MEIKYSSRFLKQYQKSNKKIKDAFRARRELFKQNPHHSLLRNHALTGDYKGYLSINVTGDWRAIYSKRGGIIIFEALGTHSRLYR